MLTEKYAIFNDKNQHDAEMIAGLAISAEDYYLEQARQSIIEEVKRWLKFRGYEATEELAKQFLTGRI